MSVAFEDARGVVNDEAPSATSASEEAVPQSRSKDPAFLLERTEEYFHGRVASSFKGRHPLKGRTPGPGDVLMRSNDYLCLAGDRRLIEAEVEALKTHGHGNSVSRVWDYYSNVDLNSFELRLARLMGAEDAVLCNSGYCANVGLIQAITKPQTPVYIDMTAHLSMWEGVTSAKATAIPFRHNDADYLERKIKQHGPGVIAVDSVYSTSGDICPIADIVAVAERNDCVLIVDETHSFGCHGPNGAGLVSQLGLDARVHFRTIGLSKAVASRGGVVVCSKRNAEFVRFEAYPAIFSTSVLPHEVAGYNAVLDIFETDGWRRDRLHQHHAELRAGIDALGYNMEASQTQIISLESGDCLSTVKLKDALERNGIFGSIFFPPAVPETRCSMRLTVNCGLTSREITHVIDTLRDIREEVEMASWKSTRRRAAKAVTQSPEPARIVKAGASEERAA